MKNAGLAPAARAKILFLSLNMHITDVLIVFAVTIAYCVSCVFVCSYRCQNRKCGNFTFLFCNLLHEHEFFSKLRAARAAHLFFW